MEEDKDLKQIMAKWGVETTSDNFTLKTMQAIKAVHEQQAFQPYTSKSLRRVIYVFFTVALLSMAVAALFMPPVSVPEELNILLAELDDKTVYNSLCFIVSLWLLLFANMWYEKRNLTRTEGDHYAGPI